MNNKIFSTVSDFVKQFRLERVVIIILAGVLVLVTTACSPSSPSASGTGEYHERTGQPTGIREYTDRADNRSRPDLSSYRDNDARDTKAARARAKELSDRAERNVRKVQDPGELTQEIRRGTPIQERVRNLSEDVGDAANQFKDDFAEGTRDNFRNLKSNAGKAGQNVQQATEDAADTVRDRA